MGPLPDRATPELARDLDLSAAWFLAFARAFLPYLRAADPRSASARSSR